MKVLSIKDDKITTKGELIEYPLELIGGRNLLQGTSNEWKTVNTTSAYYIDNVFQKTIIEAGQSYTFSWEAEYISGTEGGTVDIGCGTGIFERNIAHTGLAIVGKHSFTFTPTESHLSTHKSFAFRWYNNRNVFTFRYRNLKLEKGNKATDWTPAPEDLGLSYPDWVTNFAPSISENGILVGEFIENPNL